MRTSAAVRLATSSLVVFAALTASALVADPAAANTIHACVKPKSGATRIVGAKAKCKHGEQKLSWNTTGPRGPAGSPGSAGTPGAEGKAGASGEGAVYAASEKEPHRIETETYLLSKVVPPGSYSVSAKLELFGESTEKGSISALCAVIDTPGTVVGSGADIDISTLEDPLAEVKAEEWIYNGTLAFEGTFTSKVTSTVSLGCGDFGGKVPFSAVYDQLQALSVTGIL